MALLVGKGIMQKTKRLSENYVYGGSYRGIFVMRH